MNSGVVVLVVTPLSSSVLLTASFFNITSGKEGSSLRTSRSAESPGEDGRTAADGLTQDEV